MTKRLRRIRANTVYCCIQRTVDRQFLFKPEEAIREIVGASAGRAQRRYPVKIFWLDFNINHKHIGMAPISDDPKDLQNFIDFERLFNSLTAKEINRYLGREGPIYSTRNRISEAIDDASAEQQLFYAVTNPAKDGLIERVKHWGGFSSYDQLATGRVESFGYINRTLWHKAGGNRSRCSLDSFREKVELKLSPLPSWEALSPKARRDLFKRQVRELEKEFRNTREQLGRRAMTSLAMEKVRHRDRPQTRPPKTPQPLCHSSTMDGASEFKIGWRYYLDKFYESSQLFFGGQRNVPFPTGSIRPPVIQVC